MGVIQSDVAFNRGGYRIAPGSCSSAVASVSTLRQPRIAGRKGAPGPPASWAVVKRLPTF